MIQWNKVTWYSQILAIILGLLIFIVGFYIGQLQSLVSNNVGSQAERVSALSPLITFTGLDTSLRKIPPLPTEEDWSYFFGNTLLPNDRIEDDVLKYGDLAKRYYADKSNTHYYIDIKEADLTSDGQVEKIVSFDGGGTFGIIKYNIVQGDNIIATIESPSVGRSGAFLPDPSGNGFTMIWYRDNEMFPNGYCCPVAQMVTKFVFENNTFKPVYEQEIPLVLPNQETESEVVVSEIEYNNINEYLTNQITLSELNQPHPILAESFLEFPDWAGYYAGQDNVIENIKNLDIDKDNVEETVVFYSCVGCNAPSREIDILKDKKVIFRLSGGRLSIEPIKNEVGFYVYTTMVPAYGKVKVEFRQKDDKTFYAKSKEYLYD